MKKQLISTAAAVAVFAGGCTAVKTQTSAAASDIKIIYDGEELKLDTDPTIINDNTMVPMRAIFETFGAKIKWDGDTKTVTAKKNSKTISMTIDSDTVTKNDDTITIPTAPQIVNDRTMIPIRAVAELLGLNVDWNDSTRTVTINSKSDDEEDDSWKDNTGTINLSDMSVSGDGVSVEGNVITISKGGDFTVTGSSDNAQIVVNAVSDDGKKAKAKLRLAGAELTNPTGAAINVQSADKFYITLENGTENVISDGEQYSDENINACIYSKDDIEIKGKGSLTVNASFEHGIRCNDSLEIGNGNITINAKGDGIHVNDTTTVSGGVLTINAEGDGISAGEILEMTDGTVNITTTGYIASSGGEGEPGGMGPGGNGGGGRADMTGAAPGQTSQTASNEEESGSSKGIKADWMLDIDGGSVTVSSTDHAVHCSGEINLNGGTLDLASSAGKGVSGHENVNLNGTDVKITEATEGIESKAVMTINDGNIDITCSDDGLNAGGDSGMGPGGGGQQPGGDMQAPSDMGGQQPGGDMQAPSDMGGQQPEDSNEQVNTADGTSNDKRGSKGPGGKHGMNKSDDNGQHDGESEHGNMNDQQPSGEMQQPGGGRGESETVSSEHHIQINGGTVSINAKGDGIDSNASLVMDGGYVVVNGPSNGGDSAIDHDGLCLINGGTLIAVSASGMIENPSSSSGQYVISAYTSSSHNAGELVSICDSKGNVIVSIAPLKSYGHIMFSSDALKEGETYTIYEGGECSGTINAATGVYSGSKLSSATEGSSGTAGSDSKLITIGQQTSESGGGGMQPGGDMGGQQFGGDMQPGGDMGGQQFGGDMQPGGDMNGQQFGGDMQPGGDMNGQQPGGDMNGKHPGDNGNNHGGRHGMNK